MGISTTEQDAWRNRDRNRRTVRVEATFDASYSSGGESVGASDGSLNSVETGYIEENVIEGTQELIPSYDASAEVVKLYRVDSSTDDLAELADASGDADGQTVTVVLTGPTE